MSAVTVIITLLDSKNVKPTLEWFKKTWSNVIVESWQDNCLCKVCEQLGGLFVGDEQVSNDHCYGCVIMVTIYDLPGKLEKALGLVDQEIIKSELKFASIVCCRALQTVTVIHGNLLKKNTNVKANDV